jgi:hypothetical protein
MEFSVKSGNPEKQRTACLVLGVYESRRLTPAAEQFDAACGGYLGNLLRRGDLEGKPGQSLLLFNVPEAPVRAGAADRLRPRARTGRPPLPARSRPTPPRR